MNTFALSRPVVGAGDIGQILDVVVERGDVELRQGLARQGLHGDRHILNALIRRWAVTVISSRASPAVSAAAASVLALGNVLKIAAIAIASLEFMTHPLLFQTLGAELPVFTPAASELSIWL